MSKSFTYFPQGVCSRQFDIVVGDDGVVEDVTIWGGCHGNTQAVAALVKGRPAKEVVAILRGIAPEKLLPLAQALYDGGIRLLEVTYSADGKTPDEATAENIRRYLAKDPQNVVS